MNIEEIIILLNKEWDTLNFSLNKDDGCEYATVCPPYIQNAVSTLFGGDPMVSALYADHILVSSNYTYNIYPGEKDEYGWLSTIIEKGNQRLIIIN